MIAHLLAVLQDSTATLPFDPTAPEAYELAIASLVSVGLVQLIKLYAKFKTSSDLVKMLVSLVVAFGVSQLSRLIGFDLPGDPTTWIGTAYNAIAVWLTAAGLHAIGKKAIASAAGSAT